MLIGYSKGIDTYIDNTGVSISYMYYPQEYSDDPAHYVYYADYRDDAIPPEGITIGEYRTKDEAEKVYNDYIDKAKKYARSLLKEAYTFTDYLSMEGD